MKPSERIREIRIELCKGETLRGNEAILNMFQAVEIYLDEQHERSTAVKCQHELINVEAKHCTKCGHTEPAKFSEYLDKQFSGYSTETPAVDKQPAQKREISEGRIVEIIREHHKPSKNDGVWRICYEDVAKAIKREIEQGEK